MTRVVAIFAAVLLSWLGLGVASSSAAEPSHAAIAAYVYDSPNFGEPTDYTAPERGPPSDAENSQVSTGEGTVGREQRGLLERLQGSTAAVICTYDRTAHLVQAASVSRSGTEALQAANGDLSFARRSGVAAEEPIGTSAL